MPYQLIYIMTCVKRKKINSRYAIKLRIKFVIQVEENKAVRDTFG